MRKFTSLLALLFVLACASQAQAWTSIDKAACADNNGGNGVNASCSINSTGADLLVVSYSAFAASAATVSDSKSNTWICKTLLTVNAYTKQMCFAWYNAGALSVGASHTITVSLTSSFAGATFSAWSGSQTSANPFDQEATATLGGGGSTTGTAGPITPTGAANDLFVTSGIGHGTTEFDAATVTSFTMAARQVYVGGSSLGDQVWWATGTGATSAVWAFALTPYNLDMLAFLPGAAAPVTVPARSVLGVGK